ncbi:hypothetical protein CWE22_05380 [Pseudidiomarina aestuarii]|uniref:Porin n=1 Tax=Pseudidiomarina aestuarii TaxID=624146 RepID=A0A7Z6ZUD5_9GAMM|nr:hypothetical protein [Pseudidiomarina aestuarii]RUO41592.1 hypothetical protein CWE22_05380 [Pseudidiomarina aestuarii]
MLWLAAALLAVDVSGAAVASTQSLANSNAAESEWFVSTDLVFQSQAGAHGWRLFIEGNSSPHRNGVSELFPQANADVGTALDCRGNGRLQVSELVYVFQHNARAVEVGLMDLTGYFDLGRIANDETTQFMAADLTNNPVIAFPDYTLGIYVEQQITDKLTWKTAVASAVGLGDTAKRTYGELWDLNAEGRGTFVITSLDATYQNWELRGGAWFATEEQEGRGIFATASRAVGARHWMIRAGLTTNDAEQNDQFVGIAHDYTWQRWTLGAGVSRLFSESEESRTQLETYLRYAATDEQLLTLDVQHLDDEIILGGRLTLLW